MYIIKYYDIFTSFHLFHTIFIYRLFCCFSASMAGTSLVGTGTSLELTGINWNFFSGENIIKKKI
ncbi:unnamed protein product [Meloidogyne enterolobii]|uniref:Uncharacterized protein n=1 Tax=Meloidogyne enterolobii TaxID=390850 RepID=A0ACB0YBD5_MELEN